MATSVHSIKVSQASRWIGSCAIAVLVGHDEVDVVAAAGDPEVQEEPLLLGGGQAGLRLLQQVRVRAVVAGDAADIGLDHTQGELAWLGHGDSLL